MAFWMLERPGLPQAGTTQRMVVRARSEAEARDVATGGDIADIKTDWRDADAATCDLLDPEGPAEVIVDVFGEDVSG